MPGSTRTKAHIHVYMLHLQNNFNIFLEYL